MIRKKSGIYKILNLITRRFYVGSAVDLYRRKHGHLSYLKSNKHSNKHLQRAWNKYGKENFIFEVLEYVIDKTKLINREQYYLDTLKPHYNICSIANSTLGTTMSKEALARGLETKKKNGSLYPTIKTRKNLSRAAKLAYKTGRKVSMTKGKPAWNKGMKFGPQSTELIQKRIEARKGYRHTKKTKNNIKKGRKKSVRVKRKKVYRFSLKGKLQRTYKSVTETYKRYKLHNIYYLCRDEKYGYSSYWSFNSNFKI